jgi:hypothetical protein
MLQSSRWDLGIDRRLCGGRSVKVGTRQRPIVVGHEWPVWSMPNSSQEPDTMTDIGDRLLHETETQLIEITARYQTLN